MPRFSGWYLLLLGTFLLAVRSNAPPPANRTDCFGDALPAGASCRLGTVRFRPGTVNALAFTANDRYLAVLAGSGIVQLWNAADGRLHQRLAPPVQASLRCLAVAADGKSLAVGDEGGAIWLWAMGDLTRPPKRLQRHRGPIMDLAYSPDGRLLASVGADRRIYYPPDPNNRRGGNQKHCEEDRSLRIWNVADGKLVAELSGHPAELSTVAFLPDGKRLFSGDYGGHGFLWDVATHQLIRKFDNAGGMLAHPRFTPDSQTLMAMGWKGADNFHRWDVATGKNLPALVTEQTVSGFDLSRDGRHLALSSTYLQNAQLREARTGKLRHELPIRGNYVYCLAFSSNGKRLAIATGSSLCLWDVSTGKEISSTAAPQEPANNIRFQPDNKSVVTLDGSGYVHVGDRKTGKLLRSRHCLPNPIQGVMDLSPDGSTVIVGNAYHLEFIRGEKRTVWQGPPDFIMQTAFSPDGKLLVASSHKRQGGMPRHHNHFPRDKLEMPTFRYTVHFLDPLSGKELHRLDHGGMSPQAMFFSPDGKRLIAGNDEAITLIDVPSKRMQDLPVHPGIPVFFLSDNRTLAVEPQSPATAWKSGLILLDTQGKRPARWVTVPRAWKHSAASPVSDLLAFTGFRAGESTVTVRSMHTGKCLLRVVAPEGASSHLAFSADGKYLATPCADSSILLWDLQALLRQKRKQPLLQPRELDALWKDLGGADSDKAVDAMDRLVEAPDAALKLLKRHVRPISLAEFPRWLAELDSNSYARRERAMHELVRLEYAAEKVLRSIVKAPPSLEVQWRVKKLLRSLEKPIPSANVLASWRAVTALEWLNTTGARSLLESLAGGDPEARLSQEARAAVQRLSYMGDGR